jgi:hypothetical protein
MLLARTVQLVVVMLPIATGALVAPGAPLIAQQTAGAAASAKTGKGSISGVVLDSVHSRFLRGADVLVDGLRTSLVTDSMGAFKIDGVQPGTYIVGVFHPYLDTIGVSLGTRPFRVGPDSESVAILSIPSPATLITKLCKSTPGDQGNSAVVGHVDEPESLEPVAGAEVSIAWMEIVISKEIGLRRTPHVLTDTTDASGAFAICGLPNAMNATLRARKGSAVTAEMPISLGGAPSELAGRTLLLSLADSTVMVGGAGVSGKVTLEGSANNAASRVELVGTDAVALTNDNGEFSMANLPSGSRLLLVRHLGFEAEFVPVDLTAREPQKVFVKLTKFVSIMDPVLVMARRRASLDRVGFNERRKVGSGHYIGPEQIERIRPFSLSDLLRRVPGLRVTGGGANDEVVTSSRGGGDSCVQYIIDDLPWIALWPGDVNSYVNGPDVVAVEVYSSINTPVQYLRAMRGCTTVVLWTRLKVQD